MLSGYGDSFPSRDKYQVAHFARYGSHFAALGIVVYARSNGVMGVLFGLIETDAQAVLNYWLTEGLWADS